MGAITGGPEEIGAPEHLTPQHDLEAFDSGVPALDDWLKRHGRPCLLINAVNDPFVPLSSLPTDAVARSSWLEALFPREGGHAGFLEGPLGRRSWAEHRTLAYLRGHLLGQKSALSGPRSIR
ncbi:MAG: hypothetical protein DMD86_14165 [Candidatus Rokuibacteriota bacterium]|nr:MAG: hypothetical protein DMD86_14165 [Candidatus Rokubacteria bacterium]